MTIKDRVLAAAEFADEGEEFDFDVLVELLEKDFKIKISDKDADALMTIEDFTAYLQKRCPDQDTPEVVSRDAEEIRKETKARQQMTEGLLPPLRTFKIWPENYDLVIEPIVVTAHSIEFAPSGHLLFYEVVISWTGELPVRQTFLRRVFNVAMWSHVDEVLPVKPVMH